MSNAARFRSVERDRQEFPATKGTYALLLFFRRRTLIRTPESIGCFFIKELAVYIGRAKGSGGLRARLAWHLAVQMKRERDCVGIELPYHADYLTIHAHHVEVVVRPGWFDECDLAKTVLGLPGARPFPGFGCTGCEGRCDSHLALFQSRRASSVVSAVKNAGRPVGGREA